MNELEIISQNPSNKLHIEMYPILVLLQVKNIHVLISASLHNLGIAFNIGKSGTQGLGKSNPMSKIAK